MSRTKKPASELPTSESKAESAPAAAPEPAAAPATPAPATAKTTATAAATPPAPPPRTFSKLILENTQFLSSVVIGGAGLIATSLYQWNNSKLAQRQAEWQQARELDKAKNDWRIERAKILAQNLQTLTARGGDTAEQRFGVLLSLTRGNILDPDLAVSYALELGKDSPEYMRSVLTNVDGKDTQHYQRLASAYLPTCTQRYGVSVPSLPPCKDDALAERSRAIAEVVGDDLETALAEPSGVGPMSILTDERSVNSNLLRLIGLFSEFIGEVYDRRQWPTFERFINFSTGARLVGSFNLLILSSDTLPLTDRDTIKPHLDESRAWLESYIAGPNCDSECRGRMLSIILSNFGNGQGQFPRLLRTLLERPRAESTPFLNRLHSRLQLCQFDRNDGARLRDEVLIEAILTIANRPNPDLAQLDDLLMNQMMFLPLPADGAENWKKAQAALLKLTKGRQPKQFLDTYADEQRRKKALAAVTANSASGPPWSATKVPTTAAPTMHKHKDFCSAVSQMKDQSEEFEE